MRRLLTVLVAWAIIYGPFLPLMSAQWLVVLAGSPPAAGTPPAFIQSCYENTHDGSASTSVLTLTATPSSGNTLVLYAVQRGVASETVSSVADSAGNTWVVHGNQADATATSNIAIATGYLASAPTTVTITWANNSFGARNSCILEFSGVKTSSAQDAVTLQARTAGTSVSVSVTTTVVNDLIVTGLGHGSGVTYGSSNDTVQASRTNNSFRTDYCYRVVTTATAYDMGGTLSGADAYSGVRVALKPQ